MRSQEPSIPTTKRNVGRAALNPVIGRNRQMVRVFDRASAAAMVDSPVLIYGESGTGKELVARAIHSMGPRSGHPFIPVNCSALPRDLIESELFGYVKGAFTGANRESPGLFRAADGGVLFLDEVTEMPHATQVKLLRALQEMEIRPVGGTEEIPVDVRVIAACNKFVDQAIKEGLLRPDLYYRLSVIQIHIPPLRRRGEDIPDLVHHFIEKFNARFKRSVTGLSEDALAALMAYPWPGNVRELENVLEGIFALHSPTGVITRQDLPATVLEGRTSNAPRAGANPLGIRPLRDVEREAIAEALQAIGGNKSRTASLLGISRSQLYKKIKLYRIK